jgi:ribosomal protein S14
MKKLLERDKKRRQDLKKVENEYFVLKSIFKNLNFFALVRWNAFLKLKDLAKNNSKVSLSNRCLFSINKKRFNKLTTFSRHVLLKLIRSGHVHGTHKSSW